MTYLQAVILSVVEGVTEFLPISSTGHLILASRILNVAQTDFVKSFEIFIQGGAILAVTTLYTEKIFKKPYLLKPIITSFIPTAVVGLVLYKIIKNLLLGNLWITVISLFLGGLILIFIEKYYHQKSSIKIENLGLAQSVVIGLIQAISVIPGVSRAAATIVGGIFLGLERKEAVEFSFLLAVPTILSASVYDLFKSDLTLTKTEIYLGLIGVVGAFISAFLAIKFFIRFLQNHDLTVFGFYRLIAAAAFYLIFLRR